MRSLVIVSILAILLILTIQPSITPIYADKQIAPVITFDKAVYSPFDKVQINITYPPANADPARLDSLVARILTTSGISKTLTFDETDYNSGVFASAVWLTPNPEKWQGDLKVQKDDDLIVEFKTQDNVTFTNKVHVNYGFGVVGFNKDAFLSREKAEIIVRDLDRNSNPKTIGTLPVMVWSTTDIDGLWVTLRETSANSGEFHGFITLTKNLPSSGTRLRVADGDVITARYTDNTLIPSSELSPKGFKTFDVREVLASALIDDCFGPPIERAIASEPEIFNSVDKVPISVSQLNTGNTAIIRTEISNNIWNIRFAYCGIHNLNTQFAYITQIKNSHDVVVSLSWIRSELKTNETMKAESTWIPESPGIYTINTFVWSDIDRPTALSPQRTIEVEVW